MARNRIAASLLSGSLLALLLTHPGMAADDSVLKPEHFSLSGSGSGSGSVPQPQPFSSAGGGSALPPQDHSLAGDGGSVPRPAYRLAQAPVGAQAPRRPYQDAWQDAWRSDDWRFSITPLSYWAFGIDGDIAVRGQKRHVDLDFDDVSDKADGGFGLHAEVGRGPLGGYLDISYLKFEDDRTRRGIRAETSLDWFTAEVGLLYRLRPLALGRMSLLTELSAGLRYVNLEGEIDAGQLFDVDKDVDWIDPMIGARLTLPLTERFYLAVRGDIGGFGLSDNQSHFTWDFVGGLGYRWPITPAFAISLFGGYRISEINYDGGEPDRLDLDLTMKGPIVSLTFHF
jgi:hypothetical protein